MLPNGSRCSTLLVIALGMTCGIFRGETGIPTVYPASQPRYIWQSWTREHGLPDNRIKAILQTRDGYLWVATATALARFDGRHWQIFNRANVPHMPTEHFHAMAEGADGTLWVSFKEELFRWNGSTFARYHLHEGGTDRLVRSIFAGQQSGGIWAIAEPGLWRLHQGKNSSFPLMAALGLDRLGEIEFYSLREEADGIRIGCARGLIHFNPKTGQAWCEGESPLPPVRSILGLESDSAGIPWVLHLRGDPHKAYLSRYDLRDWWTDQSMIVHNGARPLFLSRDREGVIWFANGQGSISFLREGKEVNFLLPAMANQDFALAIRDDREGGIWIGTENNGLLRCHPVSVSSLSLQQGLIQETTWTLCHARDGSLWVGTDGGVSHFQEGRITHYTEREGLSKNAVRSIVEDPDGRIWLGTGAGLNWIEAGEVHRYNFPGDWFSTKIRALVSGRSRSLWVGTAQGLYQLRLSPRDSATAGEDQPAAEQNLPFTVAAVYGLTNGLQSDDIQALLEDRAGNLWVGTFGGGLHCLRGQEFQPLDFRTHAVWVIHEDSESALWLGTERGLVRLKNGHSFLFTPRNGLPEDFVNQILEDNTGNLWLGGERGIYRIDKGELDKIADGRSSSAVCVTYDEDEGLLSQETNGRKNQPGALKSADGRLWFCTTKGLAIFDPARLPDQTNAPSVIIEQIRSNGKPVFNNKPESIAVEKPNRVSYTPASEAGLPPGAGRILEIHYTACTFVAADKVRFKHRLVGLEIDWTDAANRRFAQYANLKPGRYRFEVLAANKYGVWSQSATAFAFTLAPFFWQTWWFYLVSGGLVTALAALMLRWRVREVRRIHQLEQNYALNEQRNRIARDIHDELGALLTHILQVSGETRKNVTQPEKVEAQTDKIASLAEEAVDNIREIVWANNAKYDTLEDLVSYLREYAASFLASTPIQVTFDFPQTVHPQKVSGLFRRHVLLVVKEALQNVVKHTDAEHVRMRLVLWDNRLELSVADDGGGLTPGNVGVRGNGLSNMQHRVSELQGSFDLVSPRGGGTEIRISVPLEPSDA